MVGPKITRIIAVEIILASLMVPPDEQVPWAEYGWQQAIFGARGPRQIPGLVSAHIDGNDAGAKLRARRVPVWIELVW
jgi:hypothetical protein